MAGGSSVARFAVRLQAFMGDFAEGDDQAAVVGGAGSQHDVAGFDVMEWDGGEVGADAGGGDDGDGVTGGDQFDLVGVGVDEGAVGCGAAAGRGSMRQ
ncbi:hypothetical protein [Kutzneria sp. CA-103260]|uniref:hypothetical protein n=1 Tax=Kutzneria sp. CA-103260 TaxID=2802641 RepID=UPI0020110740|nr:hypothetical protein [Kutzneria sp. CA-103260]